MSRVPHGQIAAAYSVKPPPRYLNFFETREFRGLSKIQLKRGFLEGEFVVDYNVTRRLLDIEGLLEHEQFHETDGLAWKLTFPGFVPFATLESTLHYGSGSVSVGAFLVLRLSRPECPVYVAVRDGPAVMPLARSLDAFVRGQAWRDAAPSDQFPQGAPYYAFGWRRHRPAHLTPSRRPRA